MDKYIPSIISLVSMLGTVAVSLWLGLAKQRNDNSTAKQTAEGNLRDDLLALVDRYEKQLEMKEEQVKLRDERLEKRNDQLSAAQQVIASQLEQITDLSLTNKQLQHALAETQSELEKFNRKVYYQEKATQ